MQNIDYAKKFRKKKLFHQQHTETPNQTISRSGNFYREKKYSQLYTQKTKEVPKFDFTPTISFWYFLLIGVFLFTSGMFVGMKISQKEADFASGEIQSFKNISEDTETSFPEKTRAEISEPLSSESEENKFFSSIPKNLQFPPKLNQTNYMIQLGTFTPEDANKYAASLIHEKQEFQGRVFRTSTGKLYLGFYYDLKEAKNVLKKVKKFQGGIFQEAEIKNVQF